MSSSDQFPHRLQQRALTQAPLLWRRVFAAVPPRVFAHALVVVLCLGVAYVGRTSRLGDQLDHGLGAPTNFRPSALVDGSNPFSGVSDGKPSMMSPPPPTAQRLQITQYVVQAGDTVSSLSQRFDISENTIIWSNNLPADGPLNPGQQLIILPVSGVLYLVQPGDTATSLATQFQSDAQAIAQVNQLTDPVHLTAGAPLVIPGGRIQDIPRTTPISPISATVAPPVDTALVNTTNPPTQVVVSQAAAQATAVPQDTPIRVPFAERAITPTPAPLAPVNYTVAPGDTLLGIAAKFGVSPESIAAASGLSSPDDTLAINQKLVVPPVPGVIHVVQEGDTLEHIAAMYSADVDVIAKANLLADPFQLKIGQTLVIPGGKVPAPAATAVPATPTPATSVYTVHPGDSLSSIAGAFGIGIETLASANHIADPFMIQPGQQIVVPSAGASSQSASRSDTSDQSQAPAAKAAPAVVAPAAVVAPPVVVVAPTATAVPRPVIRPQPVVVAAPVHSSSGGGWNVVAIASKYLGTPYVWGGTSPSGFDCSGFVWYVYDHTNNAIPRDMWGQLQSGNRVSQANLQPGDIVFFDDTYQAGLSHDGIYIGGGRFIHAADYGLGVIVSSLSNSYYASHYFGATRPD